MLQHIKSWLRFPRSSSYGTSFVAPTPKPTEAEVEAALVREAEFQERKRQIYVMPGRRRVVVIEMDLWWVGENRPPAPATTVDNVIVPESTEVMN